MTAGSTLPVKDENLSAFLTDCKRQLVDSTRQFLATSHLLPSVLRRLSSVLCLLLTVYGLPLTNYQLNSSKSSDRAIVSKTSTLTPFTRLALSIPTNLA